MPHARHIHSLWLVCVHCVWLHMIILASRFSSRPLSVWEFSVRVSTEWSRARAFSVCNTCSFLRDEFQSGVLLYWYFLREHSLRLVSIQCRVRVLSMKCVGEFFHDHSPGCITSHTGQVGHLHYLTTRIARRRCRGILQKQLCQMLWMPYLRWAK